MKPSVAALISLALLVAQLPRFSSAIRLPLWRPENCPQTSWYYHPSRLEATWTKWTHRWGADITTAMFCSYATEFATNHTYWLQSAKQLSITTRPHLVGSPAPEDDDVFSAFITTHTCHGGSSFNLTAWIEPLAFDLRFPGGSCLDTRDPFRLDRSYLLLASGQGRHMNHRSITAGGPHPGPRAFLFDLGASLWSSGMGGPSQSFMLQAYHSRGIVFDRILMWEAIPHTSKEIFMDVPRNLHAVYQYFNIPASAERNDPGNPLNILKQLATPEDFVAVKLDVDTPSVESELIKQILEDPEVYGRIDELFFEHHVNFAPMVRFWKKTIDENMTLADSYDIFYQLRLRGIRAHGWP